jgi:hypothetical protein
MEPIKHTLTARLGNLKMYREDLDQLVAMFRRSCQTVTISDDKFQYDSLEEMKKQKPESKITFFEIHGKDPGVQFLLNQTSMLKGAVPLVLGLPLGPR